MYEAYEVTQLVITAIQRKRREHFMLPQRTIMSISSIVFREMHLRNHILNMLLERDSTSDAAFSVESNHIV